MNLATVAAVFALVFGIFIHSHECFSFSFMRHFEIFQNDLYNKMTAYRTKEDMFAYCIVIYYYSAIYYKLQLTDRDDVVAYKNSVARSKSKPERLSAPPKDMLFTPGQFVDTTNDGIFMSIIHGIQNGNSMFWENRKRSIVARFANRNWDAQKKASKEARMQVFLHEFLKQHTLEDSQNLSKYKPMDKSSYEYSQFNSFLNKPSLDDLLVFIRVYGRELINKNPKVRSCVDGRTIRGVEACLNMNNVEPIFTNYYIRSFFEMRSTQRLSMAIEDAIQGRKYLQALTPMVEDYLNKMDKEKKFYIIKEMRDFEVHVTETSSKRGFHAGVMEKSEAQVNYRKMILRLYLDNLKRMPPSQDYSSLGRSIALIYKTWYLEERHQHYIRNIIPNQILGEAVANIFLPVAQGLGEDKLPTDADVTEVMVNLFETRHQYGKDTCK